MGKILLLNRLFFECGLLLQVKCPLFFKLLIALKCPSGEGYTKSLTGPGIIQRSMIQLNDGFMSRSQKMDQAKKLIEKFQWIPGCRFIQKPFFHWGNVHRKKL